jgi:hypothetical protein
MRFLKYLAIVSVLLVPAAYSHAQVSVGIGIGGYYPPVAYGPPVCAYGYYGYEPYACAPYGYYGPEWFADGIFIGTGPWYHTYYPRAYRYGYGRSYVSRPYIGRGYDGRGYVGGGYGARGYVGRGGGGFAGHGGGFRGGHR